ncbi:hypothetical protein B0T24DRAFT_525298 [Lasiosphaeria ovina]|uniref:Uncharacterized protein n=1 Tax=Lasiosphaeria ovina TaxID=92902 RepID=A0AAE0KG95_9PEZI|nr:hypothetical protein B0T24DRAFT_525298 [Lasiosphaeria ovina]
MIQDNTLYITLQYLRTVEGQRKYVTHPSGNKVLKVTAPAGVLAHATDVDRAPLDLYTQVRPVSNPLASGTLVVVLKIARSPGRDALEFCANIDNVGLMDPRRLPPGEIQWTCRVWVKEVLKVLQKKGYIQFSADVDAIEHCCQRVADENIQFMGSAKVFNHLGWLEPPDSSRDTLMESDAMVPRGRSYYGPSPMDIDLSGGYYTGSKPMIIDSSGGSYWG